ncbi:SagB family peptide dehydrogenase [Halohasta salina]|uniref:SagB family peptide dehydrogenase n=1 Tax=Halohasta salina TaxID=2961621 RepID=UPI0020A38CF7|nr:SagB family peptide dehydrogenase [Halohasta salina]
MTMPENIPLDSDDLDYLYELYHKNLAPLVAESALEPTASTPHHASEPVSKTYQRAETVPLAETAESTFLSRLRQRASYTDATERRPITDTELATLLAYSYGEIRETEGGEPRRPVASGGACYPLELYPVVVDSLDVEAGMYHFNAQDGTLERLAAGDYSEWLGTSWTWLTDTDAVSAVVVITAAPERAAAKYDELGYLFAGIETGAVIQNLQLVATELGIGSRPHNGLDYRAVRRKLRLRSDEYLMSSVVFAGSTPGGRE